MYGACRLVLLRRVLLGCAVCVVGVLGLVGSAFAADNYVGPYSGSGTARPACNAAAYAAGKDHCSGYVGAHVCHYPGAEPGSICDYAWYAVGDSRYLYFYIKSITGCPDGSYADSSGLCGPPPVTCASGVSQVFEEQETYFSGGSLVITIGSAANDSGNLTRVGADGCGFQRDVHADPVSCYKYSEGSKAGQTWCAYRYTGTGVYSGGSAGSAPSNDPATPTSNPPCETAPGGTVACSNPSNKQGEKCGTFNGHKMCFPSVPDSEPVCQSLGTTAASICWSSAPPPTDPATGNPAVPVDQIGLQVSDSAGNVTVTNTTVYNAGGSGSGASSGETGGTGQSGSGTGAGTGTGTGSGEGTFQGDSLDDVPSFGDSLNTFWTTVSSGGIVGAISGLSFTDQAGECPKPVFTFFGKQYTMDAQCTIMANVGPTLDALVYAMWGLLALFILLSA